jgi:hypothetical protein
MASPSWDYQHLAAARPLASLVIRLVLLLTRILNVIE